MAAVASHRRLELLSVSEQKCFRRCAREWQLCYELGVRPKRSADPLRFGSLWHKGQEAWWSTAGGLEPALVALHAVEESDPFDVAKAEALLTGYHARWADEPLEVLGVEVEFRIPLVNPETGAASRTWEYGGKLDAVVRVPAGVEGLLPGVWICEHKSTGESIELGSTFWSRLRMDSQASVYLVGARALGYEPVGLLYDVVRKPAHRPLEANSRRAQAETPDEYRARLLEAIAKEPDSYFRRAPVVRLEDEERDAAWDRWVTADHMRVARNADRFPRNPDSCVSFGRECDFFPICSGQSNPEDITRYRRAERRHEELNP